MSIQVKFVGSDCNIDDSQESGFSTDHKTKSEILYLNQDSPSTTKSCYPLTHSKRQSNTSSILKSFSKEFDSLKQSFSRIEFTKEQFESFLSVIRDRLGIPQGEWDVVKKDIIKKIDELLQFKKDATLELEEKKKEIKDLVEQNESFKAQMDLMSENLVVESEKSMEFLKKNPFVFKKSTLVALTSGAQLKPEDMANIERVQIGYKEKKIMIEYSFDKQDLESYAKTHKEEDNAAYSVLGKSLLKSSIRLTKRFLKLSNFLCYNIMDLCRFMKERSPDIMSLNKAVKELETKEKEFKHELRLSLGDEDLSEEVAIPDLMKKTDAFVHSLVRWWDPNFVELKGIYQALSKSTMYMVDDMQNKLLKNLIDSN